MVERVDGYEVMYNTMSGVRTSLDFWRFNILIGKVLGVWSFLQWVDLL